MEPIVPITNRCVGCESYLFDSTTKMWFCQEKHIECPIRYKKLQRNIIN